MKALFKAIIRNKIINKLIRVALINGIAINKVLLNAIEKYIPVSGDITLNVVDKKIKFTSKSDDHFITKSYYNGVVEHYELMLYQSIIKHSSTILDIGANVGIYSILGAITNPKSKIFAFEPDNFVYNRLSKNISLNKLENIKTFRYAVGEIEGIKELYTLKNDVNTTTSSFYLEQTLQYYPIENVKKEIVNQTTIDHLVYEELKIEPDFLKIDVELNELNVIKGAKKVLGEFTPIILIEIFNNEIKTQFNPNIVKAIGKNYTINIEHIFKSFGYHFYVIGHSGILRVGDFRSNPDISNYLLSKTQTSKLFYKWKDVEEFATEICSNN